MEKVIYQRAEAGLIALSGSEVVATVPGDKAFALFIAIGTDGAGDVLGHGAADDVRPIYEKAAAAHAKLGFKLDVYSYYEVPVAEMTDSMIDELNKAITAPLRIFLVPRLAETLDEFRQQAA